MMTDLSSIAPWRLSQALLKAPLKDPRLPGNGMTMVTGIPTSLTAHSNQITKKRGKDHGGRGVRHEGRGGRGGYPGRCRGGRGRGRDYIRAHQYAQTEDAIIVAGTDGRTVARITCYMCGKNGHYSDFCPETIQEGTSHNIITEEIAEYEDYTTTNIE